MHTKFYSHHWCLNTLSTCVLCTPTRWFVNTHSTEVCPTQSAGMVCTLSSTQWFLPCHESKDTEIHTTQYIMAFIRCNSSEHVSNQWGSDQIFHFTLDRQVLYRRSVAHPLCTIIIDTTIFNIQTLNLIIYYIGCSIIYIIIWQGVKFNSIVFHVNI